MRMLITGGAGFIAFHIASQLLAQGHDLTLVDNFNDFYDPAIKRGNVRDLQVIKPVKLYEIDILDQEALSRAFENTRPEAVIHLAAWAGVRPSLMKPALYASTNLVGTANVLELAREFGTERFVFGSSSSVYGGNTKVPFSEDDPVDRPISPYAATKRGGELLCHTYAHNYGMHIACLRFFTVYGPRQRPEMAIQRFANLLWEGKEIPVYGDGQSRRDYTYVSDIVSGVLAAIELNPHFETFNLGESQTITLRDLIALLESGLSRKARLCFLPAQPGDMEVTCADISKARRILGYHPQTPIREGIRKFVAWFIQSRTHHES
jgi:UDP-glucuronate 4-epimerase